MQLTYQLSATELSPYAESLMLKILLNHRVLNTLFNKRGWENEELFSELGVPDALLDGSEERKSQITKLLKQRYAQLCVQQDISREWRIAYHNLALLRTLFQLNETEMAILTLSLHIACESELGDMLSRYCRASDVRLIFLIAEYLELSVTIVGDSLRKSGTLRELGLLGGRYIHDLSDMIEWGNRFNIGYFYSTVLTAELILEQCATPVKAATLSLADFDHIAPMRYMMLDYLQSAVNSNKSGCNMLIYGRPGTGKTEFAALLAQTINIPAYMLSTKGMDNDILEGKERLENCHVVQSLLANQPSLIIFDEVEDVFASGLFMPSVAQANKAWMNHLLENNAMPMIWISNSAECIDPAYLCRFDVVLEMPDLPRGHKEALIRHLAGDRLSENYIRHFAQDEGLTPAILARGLNVVSTLEQAAQPEPFAEQVLRLFNQTLHAQGRKPLEKLSLYNVPYCLDWVACNDNIQAISDGLKRTKKGRICCYGPPGTGKTAWANWLAEQLEMPLLLKRGSDLLGKYVGENEKNIARAFAQASENKMLLVFDEVDSFLFSRESADRSWERGMVNEMLTQIERFEGLLVVSTNLMNVLDPAVLRRFDLKLKFDYLTRQQVCDLAKQQAERLGLVLQESDFMRLERIRYLTPGDFSAVARRHQFSPFNDVDSWLNALQAECDLKQDSKVHKMGF